MSTETMFVVAVIIALFILFAITLAWAERRTHDLHRQLSLPKIAKHCGKLNEIGGKLCETVGGTSACPGKVDTGFPTRTCANARIERASRFDPNGMRAKPRLTC
jgi:hypothetical protein